jgi:DNA-binding LytR/AlgR family response regulator
MPLPKFLTRPFPVIEGLKTKFITAFSFAAFVFLFLYIFQPFRLSNFTDVEVLYHTLTFGAITFGIMFLNLLLLCRIFPDFFKDENWTTGKELFIVLFYIALIGLGNFIFATQVLHVENTFGSFLYLELITLSVAALPVFVFILIRENSLLKKNRQEAASFDELLHHESNTLTEEKIISIIEEDAKVISISNHLIQFSSENEKAAVTLEPAKVYFISSADNYIKINFETEKGLVTKLLRGTLKRTEADLINHPQFYRCHKAYIVNLGQVEAVSGNARGLKLTLKNCPDEVPVSRTLHEEIKQKLEAIHSR